MVIWIQIGERMKNKLTISPDNKIFDHYSALHRKIMETKSFEFQKLSHLELANRLVVALDVQDSCSYCTIETIRKILLKGKIELVLCSRCQKGETINAFLGI